MNPMHLLKVVWLVTAAVVVCFSARFVQAQPQTGSPDLTVVLRYVGRPDPFVGQSAVFVAQLGNSSDMPLTDVDVTTNLGYRWEEADSADWKCVSDAQLETRCTRKVTLATHSGLELPIVMISAAGVCLRARPTMTVTAHLPSGDNVITAAASEPARCPGDVDALPSTGEQVGTSSRRPTAIVGLAAGLVFVAAGVWLRAKALRG